MRPSDHADNQAAQQELGRLIESLFYVTQLMTRSADEGDIAKCEELCVEREKLLVLLQQQYATLSSDNVRHRDTARNTRALVKHIEAESQNILQALQTLKRQLLLEMEMTNKQHRLLTYSK